MSAEEFRPVSAEDHIEVAKRCFLETTNAMYVWEAYSIARRSGGPLPDWILWYFDCTTRNLLKLAFEMQGKRKDDIGPRIADALHLKGADVSGYYDRWLVYGMSVRHRMQELGEKETYAIEAVAETGKVSTSTVRKAFKRYNRLFPGAEIVPGHTVSKNSPS